MSGEHEPSVILKDNDLKYKIRLPRPDARDLLKQLENDADFLLSIGVMDYSLLSTIQATEVDQYRLDQYSANHFLVSMPCLICDPTTHSPIHPLNE